MHWQAWPYASSLLITAVISAVLLVAAWRRRPAPGVLPLAVLMLTVAEWSLGYALELVSVGVAAKVFWANVQYLGIALAPLAWLVFVLHYTGRDQWLTRRTLALLAVEPLILMVLVWTNTAHGLLRQDIRLDASSPLVVLDITYGPVFWIHIAYAYVLLALGTVLLLQAINRSPSLDHGQAGALLLGAVAPWAGNLLYLSGVGPFSRLDPTPFAFALTGLAIWWSFARFRSPDIIPVARDAVLAGMGDGVIVLDGQNRVVDLNPAAQRMIGCTAAAIGQLAAEVFAGWPALVERYRDVTEARTEIAPGEGAAQRHYDLRTSPLHDRHGGLSGRLVVLRDITERKQAEEGLRQARDELERRVEERTAKLLKANQRLQQEVAERRRAEEAMEQLAYYDPLTHLPNRELFNDRLTMAITRARRTSELLAILLLDLDRFKTINDTLGHALGDQLLQSVAQRLTRCVREGDTVARLGGDEFLLLLPGSAQTEGAAKVARRIFDALESTFKLGNQELYITASIGVSIYPNDGKDAQTLLKNADTAMYRAKENHGNNYQFYTPTMNEAALALLVLENDLRRALDREELVVYYQPQVDLHTGKIVGAEALIRWNHPESGLVSPGTFIPLAEETGLIIPIGEWVLHTTCAQARLWQDAGLPPIRLAVNISANHFRGGDLVASTEEILAKTGLDPEHLELEITESAILQDTDSTIKTLHTLRAMGVHLSIDDFGTGYSSLGYLRRLPIDMVKIDRSFVMDIPNNHDDEAITTAIIAMAHSLRLRVLAEGVETDEQLKFLRSQGCDLMQGYLFSPPVPAEAMTELLQQGASIPPQSADTQVVVTAS